MCCKSAFYGIIYFKRLKAVSQPGFCEAQLDESASGLKPPDRFFNKPPAPASVVTVLALEIRLLTLKPLLNMEGLMPPAREATLCAMPIASVTLLAFASQPDFCPANELNNEVALIALPNCVNNFPGPAAAVALVAALLTTSGICACTAINKSDTSDKQMIFFILVGFLVKNNRLMYQVYGHKPATS